MKENQPEATLLYCDEHILVVNKPAGVLTLPDGYDPSAPYLVNQLKARYGALWVVHRLDRETSGVIVFARTPEAHRHLNNQFEKREVEKVYHALVWGHPGWREKTIQLPLLPNGDRKHRTIVDTRRGKDAKTSLRLIESYAAAALIEAIPSSGRRHQIRAHLAAMGFPIIGDRLYGCRKAKQIHVQAASSPEERQPNDSILIHRLALHAWQISLVHPAFLERVAYQAAYPQDFRLAIETLRSPNFLHRC